MNESVIEQFAATPEGREHLEREEARLDVEIEVADFERRLQQEEARQQVCDAAVEWWRGLHEDCTDNAAWVREDRLVEAAGRLAELEEQ